MKGLKPIVVLAFLALASAEAADTTVLETQSPLGRPIPVRVAAGPAIALLNGGLGFGAAASLQFHSGFRELYLGVETGFYRWSPTPDNRVSGHVVRAIPVLGTVTYRFTSLSGFHPYVGVAIGGAFTSGNLELLNSSNTGKDELAFEALFRPGVEIEGFHGVSLFFEPKAGILGRGNFVFLPQLGFSFAL